MRSSQPACFVSASYVREREHVLYAFLISVLIMIVVGSCPCLSNHACAACIAFSGPPDIPTPNCISGNNLDSCSLPMSKFADTRTNNSPIVIGRIPSSGLLMGMRRATRSRSLSGPSEIQPFTIHVNKTARPSRQEGEEIRGVSMAPVQPEGPGAEPLS